MSIDLKYNFFPLVKIIFIMSAVKAEFMKKQLSADLLDLLVILNLQNYVI